MIARNFRLNRQVILIFALLLDGFSIFLPAFFATQNFLNPLRSGSALEIPGLGFGTVTTGCGVDLAMTQRHDFPPARSCIHELSRLS
jgi:ribose/xylose/arabinose/galactoside ABC-type transport system permease subunit